MTRRVLREPVAVAGDPDLVGRGGDLHGRGEVGEDPFDHVVVGPVDGEWIVHINGGRIPTPLRAVEWAKECESRGAGEILLTSMDRDGTKAGYDLELTAAVAEAVTIPVIASGGAGSTAHFAEALTAGGANAALAASLFHFNVLRIGDLKRYLDERGVPVRMTGWG